MLLMAFSALLVFTLLSRLGYLNLLGLSIVVSGSMEPTLRPGDMVFYLNTNYTAGDIVVYCITPSYSIVHRVVEVLSVDTVSGSSLLVVARGDANPAPDPPVPARAVRGKVIFSIQREVWIPIFMLLLAYSLYGIAKSSIAGYSYVTWLTVALVYIIAVYALVPQPINSAPVKPPTVTLSGVYFDQGSGTVIIRYRGELSITGARVLVNSTEADIIILGEREIVFKPPGELLRQAFEQHRPLLIEVRAELNRVGRLVGNYTLLVGGRDPELSVSGGSLIIRNPNSFPISISISIKYSRGGGWAWLNQTYIIDGFSQATVEPPEGANYAYAYVYWMNQGDRRWVGLPLRTG